MNDDTQVNDDVNNSQSGPSLESVNKTTLPTDDVTTDVQDSVQHNWIVIVDGEFTCSECENSSAPETNTAEGTVEANLDEISAELELYPTKVVYGICPVCGMEYQFKLANDSLFLEPSDLEK